jgi:hypothetical protein
MRKKALHRTVAWAWPGGGEVPGIFVLGFVGKAIGFIIVLFVLALIGLFAILKKAV